MPQKNPYKLYGLIMKFFGYNYQISRFVRQLDLDLPECKKILDVGCGTGIIGLQLLERFQDASLVATDIREKFLKETLNNAHEKNISSERITLGISDVSEPDKVLFSDHKQQYLEKESVDIVCVGGALGYSKDWKKTINTLMALVRPGGYIINLEMNPGLVGKWVSRRYHYEIVPLLSIRQAIKEKIPKDQIFYRPVPLRYFPINLTRKAVVIRKPEERELA